MPRPEHICWAHEPYCAWDLWSGVPGADLVIGLMLNGGMAWAAHSFYAEPDAGDSITRGDVPSILAVEPVLADSAYTFSDDDCGLWLAAVSADGFGVDYTEGETDPEFALVAEPTSSYGYWGSAGWVALFRPWEVIPLPSETRWRDVADQDKAHQWGQDMAMSGRWDDVVNSVGDLDLLREHWADRLAAHSEPWLRMLEELAPRHECAELMLLSEGRT